MDSSGNVIKPDGSIAKGYLKNKFEEASTVFGQNQKTQEEEYQDRIDSFVQNYRTPAVKEMFETVYDGGNIHGGATTTTDTTTGDGGTPGGSPDNWKGTTYDNSAGDFKTAGGQNVNQDWSDPTDFSQSSDADLYADGGRAGYFYGGRVGLRYGGLASIL